jgi:hypothetical protein
VARPIADKLAEIISVKDFGACGDGVCDDTGAIEAAIRAAQAAGRPVFLPAGTYSHRGLTITGGIDIHGEGAPLYTVLKYTGSGTALRLQNGGGMLRNFAVLSSAPAAIGIDLFNASELSIGHVEVGGSPASGFATGVRLSQSADITFEHLVSSWNGAGVVLGDGEWANSHVVIQNSNLFAHSGAAIQIKQGTAVYIEKNWIEAFQSAILLENGGGLTTANSVIIRNNSMISTIPGALALNVNGTSPRHGLYVYNLLFESNKVTTAMGKYNVALSYALSPADSIGDFCFRNNLFSGAQLAAVHADSPSIHLYSDSDLTDPFSTPYPILSGAPGAAVEARATAIRKPAATARNAECNAAAGGTILYQPGGPGQKDTLRACVKDASDAFTWVKLY